MIGFALMMALQGAALPPDAKPGVPTARDMYISCFLLANGADADRPGSMGPILYSAKSCALSGLSAIANREGKRPNAKYTFCLPSTVDVSSDPNRAMALAYLDAYEQTWVKKPSIDGTATFIISLVQKWPCPT